MTSQPLDCAEQVERLADLVAARVAELLLSGSDLIDATEVARRFGVSRDYVYRHADELGAILIGDGSRPRKRFDPATVGDWFAHRVISDDEPETQRANRRAVRRARSVDLLPVKGEEQCA